ncbi:hypothetical protein N3K66_000534 [Trichothecium roseum]|uniref:Uncharacterized protein n=1 Tax=Trichothecium roseum TaxID=47278 RepID=A0ACC0VDU5_9HYPO|nr:hypothetical protein N3K66_000534 [Trichothecium roseum]
MATLDIPSLQAGTPKDQASLIRAYLADLPAADIPGATASLLDAVASGSIIAERVVQSWLGLTRSTGAVAAFLLDPLSNVSARRVAMKHLYIRLRDPRTEASMVQAVGGAQGLAELVTRLSEAEVTCLRDALVKSNNCRREDKQTPRGAMMTELHNILTDEDRSPDARHLGLRFALLAPACGDDALARLWFDRTCQAKPSFPGWSDTRDSKQIMVKLQGELCRHWPATCKERLTDIFSSPSFSFVPDGENQDERSEDENWTNIQELLERFLRQDLEFGLGLLAVVEKKRSIKEEADRQWIAYRLLDSLAWHAGKDSINENLHVKIWERILALLHKHPGLRLRPRREDFTKSARAERGILYFAIKSWERSMRDESSSGSRSDDQTILSRLLPFFNSDMLSRVEHANMLRLVTPHLRWTLFRTFCRQAPGYNFDIGDVATKGGKEASGTTDLKDRFSGENGNVFFALPPTHGLVLFERMLVAHGDYSFLLKTNDKKTRPVWTDIVYPDDYADGHRTRASLIQRWLQQEHTQTDSDAVTSLLDPEAVLRQLKEEQVPRRQKQAEQARDPDQRCWWAAAAVRLGVTIAGALGDMVLYRNMVLWTQRFLRDQPTIHELFAYKNPFDSDAKNILGVLPPSTRDFGAAMAIPSDIVERLRGADGAILELFRTSLLAIREPGFQSRTWTRTHEICGAVIRARLDRAHNLGWDDNKLWQEVLQPTLRLAVEAERILLQPSDDDFDAKGIGLLKEWQSPKPYTHLHLRFLDELAEARDAIWRERRRRDHPLLDALGDKKWPRGLPVQCLLPNGFFGRIDGMPYIKRRIEAALFCDPEFALSPVSLIKRDAETKAAVGGFVDDWHTALKLYLSGVNDPAERKNLLAKVVQHALGPLTGDRMGPTTGGAAARCFWREHFRCVTKIPSEMRELAPGIDDSMLPVFPEDLDLHEGTPVIWDPRPEAYRRNGSDSDSGSTQTNLPEPVNIALMLSNPTRYVMLGMSMPWPTADFGPSAYNDIYRAWSTLGTADLGRLSGASLDAFSAIALLTADLHLPKRYQPEDGAAVDPRLLAGDTTSTDTLRYPSLLLDDDFLRGYKKTAKTRGCSLASMLENLGPAVQPEALVLLTTANLRLVLRDQAEDGNIQRHVHSFIDTASYLRHGDKPDYAADILINFVKQVPDGSAYHRYLFHPGTLKHFSPRVLDKFFSSLADHIIDGLAGQAAASKEKKEDEDNDNEEGGKGANKGPRVKITTAKILPQLLQDGRIASTDFKFSMLERLLLTTRHIDVRAAATTSLVSAAAGHSSSPSTHRALAALRKHIVPIAAAMNERCPETEADWLAAEADPFKPLPEVSSGDDASRPMLNLLARGGCPGGSPGGSSSKAVLDIALEAFRASGENNRRWTLLFLKKHRLDEVVSPDSIPPVPTYPKAFVHALQLLDVREVSRQDWDMVTRYAKLMATTTRETTSTTTTRSKAEKAPMAAAVARVQENKKLMATDEARHFLDMYYLSSPFKALNFGGSWAIGLIPALRDASAQRGGSGSGSGTQKNEKEPSISIEEAVKFAYDFVNAFITSGQDRAFASAVNSIQTSLEAGGGGESSGGEEDPSNRLVRRLLRRVNELRTDEWQADPERQPPRLPDTLPLEVRAMGVPTAAQARSLPLMRYLASKLVAQLDRLADSQAPCHDDLDWIAAFYRRRPACLPLALLVGRPTLAAARRRPPTARDNLRVHLALRMLRNADYRGERRGKLLRAALAMMDGWERSPVEHYRKQVFATANKQFQIDTRNRIKRLDAEVKCDGWPEPDDDRAWEEEDSRKRRTLKDLFKPYKVTR